MPPTPLATTGRPFHCASVTVRPKPSFRLFCTMMAACRCSALTMAAFSSISTVGSDVQSVKSTQQVSEAVLASIDNQRKSVSGVSLDEEMTNLVTFQRGYQASARMLTTIDQMLDTLINRTGTVGL